MDKLYNTYEDISMGLKNFLIDVDYNLSKPKINTLTNIIVSMVKAENITTHDISKVFNKDIYSNSFNLESIEKKIWRFLNNDNFNGIEFFNSSIKTIISNIGVLKHDKLVVIFDHMYVKNNFVVLMFSLKVGSQGIPLYFKCDKTKSNRHREIDEKNEKCLFSEKVIIDSINTVIDILKPINSKITFLADRWFCNLKLMKHIDSKGHYFAIRAKVNSSIKFLMYDKKEKHDVYKHFYDLPIHIHHSLYYKDIPFGSFKFKCNLATSMGCASDDPWFILTNLEPKLAIKEYKQRFGGIESIFKNQKTNGFNLEKTHTRNIRAFENLYSMVCFAGVWLVILGADYTKNYIHVKNKIKIPFLKKSGKKRIRILSLFNLGLTLFSSLFNTHIEYKIKCNLKLYL